jgi:hypothetical protein
MAPVEGQQVNLFPDNAFPRTHLHQPNDPILQNTGVNPTHHGVSLLTNTDSDIMRTPLQVPPAAGDRQRDDYPEDILLPAENVAIQYQAPPQRIERAHPDYNQMHHPPPPAAVSNMWPCVIKPHHFDHDFSAQYRAHHRQYNLGFNNNVGLAQNFRAPAQVLTPPARVNTKFFFPTYAFN